ncbi:MAG: spore germination protein [Clostridiaceae bacterium]|nr:spore germination protein [Clostridiaceae bacterium]
MQKKIKSIIDLLTYKPANIEGFELLEDAGEKPHSGGQIKQKGLRRNTKKNEGQIRNGMESSVSMSVAENLDKLRKEFKLPLNEDTYIREFKISEDTGAAIAFVEGMVDRIMINDFILRPIMTSEGLASLEEGCTIDFIFDYVLFVSRVRKANNINDIITEMLKGFTVLFVDNCSECLLIDCKGYEKRSVEKPATETVIKGAQEAFTENLRTNITLIRRIVKNKNLLTEIIPVRSTNNLTCALMFIDGIANPRLINEVKRRINSINADIVSSDGMLEQLIEDNPFSIFPQVLSTERPDRAASFLLEGQVVIASEGSPFVFAVPVTLFHLFHTSEDANLKWQFSTAIKFIRIFGMVSSALLPGLYLALVLYHREMIPTELLVSIARAKESIPFPGLVEVLVMEISFEVIREAGIRVPGVIGPTLGIIGALILGQAAVAANLVSPILIIIVAVTGLGNFAIPNYSFSTSIRLLRFLFIFVGCIAGFYGIAACIVVIIANMCNLKSFGVPFLSPVAPQTGRSSDLVVRKPVWQQKKRADYLNVSDESRQPEDASGND